MIQEGKGRGMEIPQPEPTEEIRRSRDRYETGIAALARKKTNLREHLTGTGVTKDEIIRADAEQEKLYRERLSDIRKYRKSAEPVAVEELQRLQDSSLNFEERFIPIVRLGVRDLGDYREGSWVYELNGEIKGKKVKIKRTYQPDVTTTSRPFQGPATYEGTIDGKKITPEDAEAIYHKYAEIASSRSLGIKKIKQAKHHQRADKKTQKNREKTSKEVNDILK